MKVKMQKKLEKQDNEKRKDNEGDKRKWEEIEKQIKLAENKIFQV